MFGLRAWRLRNFDSIADWTKWYISKTSRPALKGVHPVSYSKSSRGKTAMAWTWPHTSTCCRVKSSWRCVSTRLYALMTWAGTTSKLTYHPLYPGFVHDCVIVIFHWRNPSGCTMALKSLQHLTEMITRSISWRVQTDGAWGWQPWNLRVTIV